MSLHPQNSDPSLPGNKTSTGAGILGGLLLTLGFHFIHVLCISPFLRNEKAVLLFWFFGFTQLLYMIPAIVYFRRCNERGMMIGLMIGASLTFVLGLPFAQTGYWCATRDPNTPLW
jgi:Na+/proline symporter